MRFELTDEQIMRAEEWFAGIMKRDNRNALSYGAIGGGLSYIFTQTGLGVIVVAREAHSGETINLTDFSDW